MSGIRRFARLDARLVPYDWAWARDNGEAIAAHWDRRRAILPKLFNGRVLMIGAAQEDGARLALDFFATDYANLLAHIDWGVPDPAVRNGFAMGALRSRDGAFVLGVMAAHTANAGALYFPAGTPDMGDVREDGSVDLEGSLLREIREETGLAVGPELLAPAWALVRDAGRAALMRGLRIDADAEDIRSAILANLGRQAEPELADVVILRRPKEIDETRMPGFLPAYLRWAFAGEPQR